MITLLLLAQMVGVAADSMTSAANMCLLDARTRVPVVGAQLVVHFTHTPSPITLRLAGACARVHGDSVGIARIGYQPRVVSLRASALMHTTDTDTIFVALTTAIDSRPGSASQQLDTTVIRATRNTRTSASVGAVTATVRTDDARAAGASNANALLSLLPYTNTRSARGETGLSLRGARREQVAITLDGMPLNDPATGIADIADIPLAGLQSATVVLGADPVGAGSGATGGVLALTSSAQRVLSVRTGAFGQQQAEGAWHATSRRALWQASASLRNADNDFAFTNDAGVSSQRETRVNNDERRATLSAGVIGSRAQLSLLASTGERGMVGAANVRSYDADRARTDRVLLRSQWQLRGTSIIAGARRMQLRYRDPTRPALDSRAVAWAGDTEWRGLTQRQALNWRVGAGADQLSATGGITQQRRRGFAAVQRLFTPSGNNLSFTIDVGVRTDFVEGQGLLPTASLGLERRLTPPTRSQSLTVMARVANAVRVPTLYDLYFSSPQRLFVRALNPERVIIDASTGVRASTQSAAVRVSIEGSLVARDTRDAIVWFPGNFGWSPANVGMERLRGVESRAELAAPLLSLSGWFTAYDAMLSTGGMRIPTPYVPRISGGAQLHAHRTSAPRFPEAVVVWRASGARPYTAGPRNLDFELAPVSFVDVTLSQRLHTLPHWPLSDFHALIALSAENATDAQWQSVRGFPSPGRSWAIVFTLQHFPK